MPEQKTDRKGISVEISLSGDQWADTDELELRWFLEDQVEERGIGIVHGGGSGGGWMDFSFEVADEQAVAPALEAITGLLSEKNVKAEVRTKVFDIYDQICDETPDFHPGDCLGFRFSDGDYGALFVLACWNEQHGVHETLVAVLDYKHSDRPVMDVFESRQWLIGTHHSWRGKPYLIWLHCFGGIDVQIIGSMTLRGDEPEDLRFHLTWDLVGEYVIKEKNRDNSAG